MSLGALFHLALHPLRGEEEEDKTFNKWSGCDEAMKGHEPRSSSSCAACKFLKRRCTPNCIFAPYFRSDERKKFAKIHKVFGASNVSKILCEVPEEQREDTVNSLAYEAEARLKDPVYGCIGAIALLQRRMVELQHDLAIARARLARCSSVANSSSSSSQLVLHDLINLPPFADLSAVVCSGLSESFFCFDQNSSELNRHHEPINGFTHIPFLL